jgi:hypothetical protein
MRSYKGPVQDLIPLPTNPDGEVPRAGGEDLGPCVSAPEGQCSNNGKPCAVDSDCSGKAICETVDVSFCDGDPTLSCFGDQDCIQGVQFVGPCPKDAADTAREYEVWAVQARDVLPDPDGDAGPIEGLVYNASLGLHDPTALLYVLAEDIDPLTGMIKGDRRVEPLILRAAAGECIKVNLHNKLLLQAWDQAVTPNLVFSCESLNDDFCDLTLESPVCSLGKNPCTVESDCLLDSCVPGTLTPVHTEEQALAALDDPNLLLVLDEAGNLPNGVNFDQLHDMTASTPCR